MRILHVIPAVGPCYGGPSQVVLELCRALQDGGVQAEICTTDANGQARLPVKLGKPVRYQDVCCHFFRRDCSEAFKYSRSMADWLNANIGAYDVAHIHAVFSYSTYAAAQACHESSRPYIVRPLGTLEPWSMSQKPIRKQIAWRLVFRNLVRGARLIHYTTEQERKWTEESLGLRGGIVIPNGVDESLLAVQNSGRFRKTHGIPDGAPILFTLSRLHPKKGLDLLLKAFAKLKGESQLRAWHLVVAGDGEAAYVQYLKSLLNGTNAHSFVHWTGWLADQAKLDALAEADLFVLSSHQENFGIGAVEAMACGTPVLLSQQVGLATQIENARAGWVTKLDVVSLGKELVEATRDPAELSARGAAAKTLVAKGFTWPRIATEWASRYKSIRVQKQEPSLVHA
ncbi:MAG TPA: glycosyltransferase [Verrucomicrobiae bacterium]|nr:glycosyltransferase [Verrucomicrobiae bacterium]